MRFFLILISLLFLSLPVLAETLPPAAEANQIPNQPANQGLGEKLLAEIVSLKALSFGPEDGRNLYILADPSCPYCLTLDKALMAEIAAGRSLRLHVVPVPVLSAESQATVLQIYRAADSSAAWQQFVNDGKLPEVLGDEAAITAGAQHTEMNFNIMKRWNIRSVPTLVWRAADGRVMITFGTPNDMQALWNSMGFAQ